MFIDVVVQVAQLHQNLLDPRPLVDDLDDMVNKAAAALVLTVVTIVCARVPAEHLLRIDLALERIVQCQVAISEQSARDELAWTAAERNRVAQDEAVDAHVEQEHGAAADRRQDMDAAGLVEEIAAELAQEERDVKMRDEDRWRAWGTASPSRYARKCSEVIRARIMMVDRRCSHRLLGGSSQLDQVRKFFGVRSAESAPILPAGRSVEVAAASGHVAAGAPVKLVARVEPEKVTGKGEKARNAGKKKKKQGADQAKASVPVKLTADAKPDQAVVQGKKRRKTQSGNQRKVRLPVGQLPIYLADAFDGADHAGQVVAEALKMAVFDVEQRLSAWIGPLRLAPFLVPAVMPLAVAIAAVSPSVNIAHEADVSEFDAAVTLQRFDQWFAVARDSRQHAMLTADFVHCEQQTSTRYPARAIVPFLTSRVRIAPFQLSVELSTLPLARTIEPRAVAQVRLSRLTHDVASLLRLDVFAVAMSARAVQDWHVELSGVNMWDNVETGVQHFWLAPPTEGNLAALRLRVMGEDVGSDAAFMDRLEGVQCTAVGVGLTLFVPSGWLHAAYAPVDTCGFVGTFYAWSSIATALAITRFEDDTNPH
ncbi:hypothetical protein GGF32_006835 [Allomyces javanicus]|nr:hypothetical protein GGF32_006835 [Allomyces javanicus]